MNKVLNRPMFRQTALRQGALKPIHAQTGVMVGAPTQDIRNTRFRPPAINQQGFFGRQIRPRAQRFANVAGKAIADVKNFPTSAVGQVTRPNVRIPFGMGGGVGGLIAGSGLYQGVSNVTSKLGFKDDSMIKAGLDLGISGLLFMNPYARAAGLAYGGFNLARSALGAGVDYVAQKPPGTTKQALSIDRGEPIFEEGVLETGIKNLFTPVEGSKRRRRDPRRLEAMNQRIQENIAAQEAAGFKPRVSSRRANVEERMKQLGLKKDEQAVTETTNSQLAKEGDQIAQNAVDEGGAANLNVIQEDGITNETQTVEEAREQGQAIGERLESLKQDPETKTTKNEKQQQEDDGNNNINFGGPSKDVEFNKTIQLAKKYYDELSKGQGSQANLVFLANLASGLMTGTTRKAGVGGALEVLGQSLGPAVNNYVTVKLKEGELRANIREQSLSAALEHMKNLNTAAKIDYPDRTPGVFQALDSNGELINFFGYQLKDGTVQAPRGEMVNGRETFVTVPQQGTFNFKGLNGLQFSKFRKQSEFSGSLADIQDTLLNRYKAFATTQDVLRTLDQPGAKAGIALTFDATMRRLGEAGLDLIGKDTASASLEEAEKFAEQLAVDEKRALDKALESNQITEAEHKAGLDRIDYKSLKDKALDRIKGSKGFLSGLSRKEQERLAVQEVTLVYALANTFKDQDRLTQRDINAAREIVNIFSLTRGSKAVRDSIQAISEQLRQDILRNERNFTATGGLFNTLQFLRKSEQFTPDSAFQIEGSLFDAMGEKEFKDAFDKAFGGTQ
jgi:hypothetical protein